MHKRRRRHRLELNRRRCVDHIEPDLFRKVSRQVFELLIEISRRAADQLASAQHCVEVALGQRDKLRDARSQVGAIEPCRDRGLQLSVSRDRHQNVPRVVLNAGLAVSHLFQSAGF